MATDWMLLVGGCDLGSRGFGVARILISLFALNLKVDARIRELGF